MKETYTKTDRERKREKQERKRWLQCRDELNFKIVENEKQKKL